jgi:acetyl-CoA carboxylase carboxyltransferase component
VHWASGVIDILVKDEAEAIAAAKKYLGYFDMVQTPGEALDQMPLRDLVPENPRRAYNVRTVVQTLCDRDSVMEVKAGYGKAAVTAFGRINGRTVGVIANQPMYLAGAMDTPACLKMARFIQICDAFDIPLVVLCDTPGLMVGPEVEKTGLMRHSARVLTALANATIPVLTVVLRKAYGLGYYIMGSRPLEPAILVAWPTAEFGGMGLEGAVNIIYAKELEAAATPEERAELHADLTAELKRSNTAVESAARFLYDDVIDPANTRDVLIRTLETLPQPAPRTTRKRVIEPF